MREVDQNTVAALETPLVVAVADAEEPIRVCVDADDLLDDGADRNGVDRDGVDSDGVDSDGIDCDDGVDRSCRAADGSGDAERQEGESYRAEALEDLLDRSVDFDSHVSLSSTALGVRVRLTASTSLLGSEGSFLLANSVKNVFLAAPEVLAEGSGLLGYRTSVAHVLAKMTEFKVLFFGDLQLLWLVFLSHVLDVDREGDEILSDSVEDGDPARALLLDIVAGLASLDGADTDVDLGPENCGAVFVVPGYEHDELVGADGIKHLSQSLLVSNFGRTQIETVAPADRECRLARSQTRCRGRSPADVRRVRPSTGREDHRSRLARSHARSRGRSPADVQRSRLITGLEDQVGRLATGRARRDSATRD